MAPEQQAERAIANLCAHTDGCFSRLRPLTMPKSPISMYSHRSTGRSCLRSRIFSTMWIWMRGFSRPGRLVFAGRTNLLHTSQPTMSADSGTCARRDQTRLEVETSAAAADSAQQEARLQELAQQIRARAGRPVTDLARAQQENAALRAQLAALESQHGRPCAARAAAAADRDLPRPGSKHDQFLDRFLM